MGDPVVTWHFCSDDRRLGYGDGREVRRGAVHAVSGTPKLCEFGLHGSLRAIDALAYAPGTIVSRCEHRGIILIGPDKLVSTEREYIAVADATSVLLEFTEWCVGTLAAHAAHFARAARAIYAAHVAAHVAARFAAHVAAHSAAHVLAHSAAHSAAHVAEQDRQNEWLEARLLDLIQKHAADD